jgi:hypothetical protein
MTEHLPLSHQWDLRACEDLGDVRFSFFKAHVSAWLTEHEISHYNGAASKDDQPLAFVGKGITFDSGGISLKPGAVCFVCYVFQKLLTRARGHETDAW